jgi:hypothetical protein
LYVSAYRDAVDDDDDDDDVAVVIEGSPFAAALDGVLISVARHTKDTTTKAATANACTNMVLYALRL